jgi:hypothetical protein
MVQVIKDPIGTKGARLSTQISIAGRLLVFLPQDDHIGVSQKIPLTQRDELRATATAGGDPGWRFYFAHQRRRCLRCRNCLTTLLSAQGLGPNQGRLHPLAGAVYCTRT